MFRRIVRKASLSDRKQSLNGILHTFVDFSFMQYATKTFKDRIHALGTKFHEHLPHFLGKIDRHFDRVIRGLFQ